MLTQILQTEIGSDHVTTYKLNITSSEYQEAVSLELGHVVDRPDDVVGGDAEHVEQLGGRPRPRHGVDCELPHDHVAI